MIGVRELYADLDLKPGGLSSYSTAETIIRELSTMLGVLRVAVVHSGHGLQPHWAIERDAATDWTDETSPRWSDATALYRRWGRLVAHVAEINGGEVDNVFDLSRVLRVPGTTNTKSGAVKVTVTYLGRCAVITLKRLAEVLDEYSVPAMAEDRERLDDMVSSPASWTFGERTCPYVAGMVKGWAKDKPSQRHPFLVSQSVRLAAAHRAGCITQDGLRGARTVLAERFRTRLNVGQKRSEAPGEIAGAFGWGVVKVSTFDDQRLAGELGDHRHPEDREPVPELPPTGIGEVHAVFRKWFGDGFDLDVLDAVLSCAAAGLALDGDPAGLLVVGGSGAAKTESVSTLAAAGAIVTSTISSPGALLSGTSSRERTSASTGGLLRKVGDRGILVLKDVTSVVSMHREARAELLAALREVADGFWERNLGVDGGVSIQWRGRCTIIGAVTTAWDGAHAVVASMGDRFLLVRMPEGGARAAGEQALDNDGHETPMRAELSAAVGGLLQHLEPAPPARSLVGFILPLADVTTWARTAVISDYRGDVMDAHAREMPTRFAKQLAQVYRVLGASD